MRNTDLIIFIVKRKPNLVHMCDKFGCLPLDYCRLKGISKSALLVIESHTSTSIKYVNKVCGFLDDYMPEYITEHKDDTMRLCSIVMSFLFISLLVISYFGVLEADFSLTTNLLAAYFVHILYRKKLFKTLRVTSLVNIIMMLTLIIMHFYALFFMRDELFYRTDLHAFDLHYLLPFVFSISFILYLTHITLFSINVFQLNHLLCIPGRDFPHVAHGTAKGI